MAKGAVMRLGDVALSLCCFDKARLVKGSSPGSWFAQFWDSWKLEERTHEWLPNFSGDGVGDGAMETQIMSDNLWLTSTEYFPQKRSSFVWKSPGWRTTWNMGCQVRLWFAQERHAVSLDLASFKVRILSTHFVCLDLNLHQLQQFFSFNQFKRSMQYISIYTVTL